MRVAIIGLGTISQIHLPIIKKMEGVDLVAVCDIDEKKKIEGVNFYKDHRQMLEKEDLDIVHICLPHYLHSQVSKDCLDQGVNVLLEKPLGLNYQEGLDLYKYSKDKKAKLAVCFQNRLNRTVVELEKVKQSRKYGQVVGVKGLVTWYRSKDYYDQAPWRSKMAYAGGGVMINQSIHTLDLMYLFAGRAKDLKGGIDNIFHEDIEVEDMAYANINYENQARGLFISTVSNIDNSSVELEVFFDRAKFVIKNNKLFRIDDLGEWIYLCEDEKFEGSKFYYGAGHEKLIRGFYQAVEEDSDSYINIGQALESIKLIDGIRQSSKLKERIYLEE